MRMRVKTACQTILKFITTPFPLHSSICYICQKEVEETSSFPDHLLSDCSKFALSPFTISDLYNSIGTEDNTYKCKDNILE